MGAHRPDADGTRKTDWGSARLTDGQMEGIVINEPTSRGRLGNFVQSSTGLALIVFLAVAGYFLWTEHRAHAIAALPYLLLGGCLVMHLFMHHGHGHGGHGEGAPSQRNRDDEKSR